MHLLQGLTAAFGPVPSSVYITTCPQLAKAAVRAADEGAGFDPYRPWHNSLFDHLVVDPEQQRWHGEPEHPGGLVVDDQLDSRKALNRQAV